MGHFHTNTIAAVRIQIQIRELRRPRVANIFTNGKKNNGLKINNVKQARVPCAS